MTREEVESFDAIIDRIDALTAQIPPFRARGCYQSVNMVGLANDLLAQAAQVAPMTNSEDCKDIQTAAALIRKEE